MSTDKAMVTDEMVDADVSALDITVYGKDTKEKMRKAISAAIYANRSCGGFSSAALAQAEQPVAPVDVYRVLKRAHENGMLDGDHLSSLSREIAALASPAEVVEPVAWMRHNPGFLDRPTVNPPSEADRAKGITASPLYTHPPQQEPARLREADVERIAKWLEGQRNDVPAHGWEFAAALRAALAEDGL